MRTNSLIAILVLCTVTVATGWVNGRLSNRWGESVDLVAAGQRLEAVPDRVGNWEMQFSRPFEDDVVEMLQCAGHFNRAYVNSLTGETVTVELLVGPPGPTAAHTPEICYSSRNHEITEESNAVQTRPAASPDETFWRMTLRSTDIEQRLQRVYYSWCGPDGCWRAAKNPRFEYGGQGLLYKVQLASELREAQDADDPCRRFLQDFLPALQASQFKAASR
jgi:hypothetical protein